MKLFDKTSTAFLVNFALFLVVSIGIIIGISVYADSQGVNVAAAIANFLHL